MTGTVSTPEAVEWLWRRGLRATEASLRADVHRGLVSPSMPSLALPGRGTAARWTPAALRRLEYLARLRRRGVNGRVLPMLAFVYDGWGWNHILPAVQRAARVSAAIDRRSLRRRGRVRTPADLMLNMDTGAPGDSGLDYRSELLPARQAMATSVWFGAPPDGLSFAPFAIALRRLAPGAPPTEAEAAEIRSEASIIEARRRQKPLAAADVPEWLCAVSPDDVERGRRRLLALLDMLRDITRSGGGAGSNPLLMMEETAGALAATLRKQTGRPSAATLLGSAIAQGIVHARYLSDEEMPDTTEWRSLLAPLLPSSPPAATPNE